MIVSSRVLLIGLTTIISNCAYLHHCQIGEIDNRHKSKRFEIKVSEMGFNLEEAGEIAKALSKSEKTDETVDNITAIIGLFQYGPTTGNKVFNDKYAKNLIFQIREACPSGKITGLTSIREMRKYPVISGEIVKVSGYCIGAETKEKKSQS